MFCLYLNRLWITRFGMLTRILISLNIILALPKSQRNELIFNVIYNWFWGGEL